MTPQVKAFGLLLFFLHHHQVFCRQSVAWRSLVSDYVMKSLRALEFNVLKSLLIQLDSTELHQFQDHIHWELGH